MQTALQELETYLNDSSQREELRSHLEAFGFDDFNNTTHYFGANQFTSRMKRFFKVKCCSGVGIIDPNVDEHSYQKFSIVTPQNRLIRGTRLRNFSQEEVGTFLEKFVDYVNLNLQTLEIAYTIYDEETVVFGTPNMITNPLADIGDRIHIVNTEPLQKLSRRRLEELF